MSDKTLPITGGCLCGAVRFEATEPPSWVAHCHCRMCQKGYGHPSGIFVGFHGAQKEAFRFTRGCRRITGLLRGMNVVPQGSPSRTCRR